MKKYIQEHKYVLLVLYLPIYLIWFALVERMVPSTEFPTSVNAGSNAAPATIAIRDAVPRKARH